MILLDAKQLTQLRDTGWLRIIRFKGGQSWVEGRAHKIKRDMYQKDAVGHVRVTNIKDVGNAWELTLRQISVFDYLKERKPGIDQLEIF